MAENSKIYYGSGIGVAGNIDIGALGLPADSRVMVKDRTGLTELQNAKRVYDGMLVYVESDQTYHKCRVVWDANMAITSCTWTEVVIKSEAELVNLITSSTTAAMEFKGATDALPTTGIKGDMYKVSGAFEVAAEADAQGAGFTTKIGDSIVYDGEKWYHIPSGDDIEDTWRTITGVNNDADLTFAAGAVLDVNVEATGTVTYSHEAVAAPVNTNADGDEKVREYITAVETDGYGHITGFKTNIETVVDTSYEFEGTTVDSNVSFSVQKVVGDTEEGEPEVIKLDAYTQKEVDDAIKVVTDNIAIDRQVWDLAGTAVQTETFNKFKEENTQAIADAVAPKLDAETFNDYIDGKSMSDEDLKKYADDAVTNATKDLDSMSTKDANDYYTKNDIDGKNFANKTEAQDYATTAQTNAEAKAAELDAALKQELTGVINGVDAKFENYVTTAKYAEDKLAEDAIDADHETRIAAVEAKFGEGEGTVEAQISAAISGVQSQIDALDNTYATDAQVADAVLAAKNELGAELDLKLTTATFNDTIADYRTSAAQDVIDAAQDREIAKKADAAAVKETTDALAKSISDMDTAYKAADAKTLEDAQKYADARKAEVVEMIDGVASAGLTRSIVTELPDASTAALNTIYMIKRSAGLDNKDVYDEYIVIEVEGTKHFELLGNTELDLSNYYTKSEIEALNYATTDYVDEKDAETLASAKAYTDARTSSFTYNTDGELTNVDIGVKGSGYEEDENYPELAYTNGIQIDKNHVFLSAGDALEDVHMSYVDVKEGSLDIYGGSDVLIHSYGQGYEGEGSISLTQSEFVAHVCAGEHRYNDTADINLTPEAFEVKVDTDKTLTFDGADVKVNDEALVKQGAVDTLNARLDTLDEAITVTITGDGEGGEFLDGVNITAGYGALTLGGTSVSIEAQNNPVAIVGSELTMNGKAVATEEYVDGKVAEVQEAVDAIDVGVTKIVAGNDIVVTPVEGTGEVTITHETFTTGEYTKDPTSSDKTGDQYFFTSVSVDNGHVTGANVKSLASVLEAMSFILDGGTSIN